MQSSIQPPQRLSSSSSYAFSWVYLPRSIRLLSTEGPYSCSIPRNSQADNYAFSFACTIVLHGPRTIFGDSKMTDRVWRFKKKHLHMNQQNWLKLNYRPTGLCIILCNFGGLAFFKKFFISRLTSIYNLPVLTDPP